MKFVSLHHHTTFSYMDGYGTPEQHVKRAAELGMTALAHTEHGNVSSHVRLEKAAQKHGIKPIFGLEAYTGPQDMRETGNMRKWHLTILAMNPEGYQNLNRIATRSWEEGFYRWPTVTSNILRDHSEGLVVLSGCADSKVACDLLGGKGRERGDIEDARRTIRSFKKIFGDRYYLECQQFPELGRTQAINSQFAEFSRELGVPLVATADCHYPVASDNEMQKILHAAGRNTGTVSAAEATWEYDIRLTLPDSDRAIISRLRQTGLTGAEATAAVRMSGEIAERCTVELPKAERVRYPLQQEMDYVPGMTPVELLRKWMNAGWKFRGINLLPKHEQKRYYDRCMYELQLVDDKDFVDYFLMLSDVVRHCKDNGIPVGPARGSAAASLLCYLLRITEVDPMRFPLMLFERFIDPNRTDLPDVDLDFDDELRDECRQHLIRRFGADKVGNIGTFTKYKGKNSVDDVARVYQIPKWEVEKVKEFIVERSGGDSRADASLMDTVEMFPQVKEVFERNPQLYNAVALEGNYKGFGVHAAGVVVASQPINNFVATYSRLVGKHKNKVSVLSVDKKDGEILGLLKGDFLGLSTMGMIRHALNSIGMTLEDLYKIPLDDPETLAAFERADVIGIFQFEGRTTRMVCQEVRPTDFMSLADINALSRPGPLHSGSTGDYIAAKHGRLVPEHLHPIVDEFTQSTYGQIVYQEQILNICRKMGKFPWTDMGQIRRVISQKMGEAAFQNWFDMFASGAESQGIPRSLADKVWRKMVTAGTYAFNVAHCISYSMLGFWCMWLKVHHPEAFYAATLRKTSKADRAVALMRDMQDVRFGRSLPVLPPHMQESGFTWSPVQGGVRAGFSQIPGIGEKTAKLIVEQRAELGLETWDDLVQIKGIGPKTVLKIKAFATEEDPFGVGALRRGADEIKGLITTGQMPLAMPDTLADEIPYEAKVSEHVILVRVRSRNLQDLFENHMSRNGVPLDPATVKDPHLKDSMTLYCEDESGLCTIKVNRWSYPRFKDDLWSIKLDSDFVWMRVVKKAFAGKTVHLQDMAVISMDDGEEDEDVSAYAA